MPQVTIDVSDSLAKRLDAARAHLPEVLERGLEQLSPVPNEVYRSILEFLAGSPSPEAILGFKPSSRVQERIRELLEKNRTERLTPTESAELDEYERIEHYIRMLKIHASKTLQAMRNG